LGRGTEAKERTDQRVREEGTEDIRRCRFYIHPFGLWIEGTSRGMIRIGMRMLWWILGDARESEDVQVESVKVEYVEMGRDIREEVGL
jgi:hypothetical protein